MLYTSPWSRFELKTSVARGTDCIGSCKSNYHTITATTVPLIDLLLNDVCVWFIRPGICLLSIKTPRHIQETPYYATDVLSSNLDQGEVYNIICDQVCQWLSTGRWFSPGHPVSSTNKTDRHDITEVLLKV
jgi:hypothetical protein